MNFFYNYFNFDFYFIVIINLLILGLAIFGVFITRAHLIITLICLEIILFIASLNFIIFSNYLDDMMGQFFSLMILSVAASESSIGLALLVAMYRIRGLISIDFLNNLKG